VLGKADLIDPDRRAQLERQHPDAVLVSAVAGEGLVALTDRIEEEFARTLQEVELLLPYEEGGRLAELHALAGDLTREETPEGVRVLARLPVSAAARYARFSLTGRPA
jgi:GTP-binding protein HflX